MSLGEEFVSRVLDYTNSGLLKWSPWNEPGAEYGARLPSGQMLTLGEHSVLASHGNSGKARFRRNVVLSLRGEDGRVVHAEQCSRAASPGIPDMLWDLWKAVRQRQVDDEIERAIAGLKQLASG